MPDTLILRLRLALTLVLPLLATGLCAAPAAAQQVTGVVRTGAASFVGASVGVEVDGVARSGPPSDRGGAFVLDLAALYGRSIAGSSDLLLKVTAPGFVPLFRSLRVAQAAAQPLAIGLLPDSGGAALSAQDQRKLAPFVNPSGSGSLMLVPYDLPPDLANPRLVERLRFNIESLVITYVQAALHSQTPDLAVRLLPLDGQLDQERLRAVGRHVNALAVVSGNGERVTPGEVLMSSSYVMPPQTGPAKPLVAFVDDRIPAAALASPELHRQLNRLWGRATILAMAVRDLNAAPAPAAARREALLRVRSVLVAERANIGPRHPEFGTEIDALLAIIARELKP
jgi:hypothetical protein